MLHHIKLYHCLVFILLFVSANALCKEIEIHQSNPTDINLYMVVSSKECHRCYGKIVIDYERLNKTFCFDNQILFTDNKVLLENVIRINPKFFSPF